MPNLIWHVDDDAEFCSLAAETAERIGLAVERLTPDEAEERHAGPFPNAVIVDGELFRSTSARRPGSAVTPPRYFDCADRVLVCTAYLDEDLDVERMRDRRIRLLRKPFDLDDFEVALAWLGGDHRDAPHAAADGRPAARQLAIVGAWRASSIPAARAE